MTLLVSATVAGNNGVKDDFLPFATASGAISKAGERACTEAIAGGSSKLSKASGAAKHAVPGA